MNNRILFCCGTMAHGGAERVISILANRFAQLGYEVTILLYYKAEVWYELDPSIRVVFDEDEIGKANALRHITWRHRFIKELKPVCTLSFLASINTFNLIANIGTGVPIIVADRNDPSRVPESRLRRVLRDFMYRFADGVVVQNERNKRYFSKTIQSKSTVIFNPVNIGNYKGAAAEDMLSSHNVIWVARLIPQKNPMMMIDAMQRVLETFPDLQLNMYGEGPMRQELEDAVVERRLGEHIHLMGAVQDIYARMSESCLYVLTSDYEGMPNTLIEAMCVGLPVISTDVPGTDELISSPQNGAVIPCGDVDVLVSAMNHILSSPEEMLTQSRENAKLADKLTVDNVFSQWMQLIDRVK